MAQLLLFAAIREAAGVERIEIDGRTPKEVINLASQEFGRNFDALLPYCKIYVNDEVVHEDIQLNDDDVIALLPPVSGGF